MSIDKLGVGAEFGSYSKKDEPDDLQKWLRHPSDANGWFHLQNPKTGKLLTAESATEKIMEGKFLMHVPTL